MIYLDNAASGKVLKETADFAAKVFEEDFFNPSALYMPATELKKKLEHARKTIAESINARPEEIYFTSGATEANNWAVFSGFKNKKAAFITTEAEHASVYECALSIKNSGADVKILPLYKDGTVNDAEFEKCVQKETSFLSVIHVNNETGAQNDIERLCKIAKSKNKNAVFHSDGVQAFLKRPFDVKKAGIDIYSFSAHKIGALKGTGALYINSALSLKPFILGGGQEAGARSGTENSTGILSFAEAVKVYQKVYDQGKIRALSSFMKERLSSVAEAVINSSEKAVPDIISVSFPKVKAEVLIRMLSDAGIYISSGSACSAKHKGNRVLSAMALSPEHIEGSIRISFPPDIEKEEVTFAAEKIIEKAGCLRCVQ